MPPKKATETPKPSTPGDEVTPSKEPARELISIEDHSLPKSIVTRLAKGVLPPNTQIQGNATLAITKGATVFVNYLASHANEICQREGRKTLNPQDVLRALDDLEFPDFKPRLEAELAKFNEIQADKRTNYRAKKASEKTTTGTSVDAATGEAGDRDGGDEQDGEAGNGEPAAKKARREVDEDEKDGEVEDSYILGGAGRRAEGVEDEEGDEEEVEDEEDTLEVDEGGDEEVEEQEEEQEEEEEDEALDNGGDSD